MFKPEIITNNLQGYLSSIINEIVEKCDSTNCMQFMTDLLSYVLNTLSSVIQPGFDASMDKTKKENLINYLGGLAQIVLVRVGD